MKLVYVIDHEARGRRLALIRSTWLLLFGPSLFASTLAAFGVPFAGSASIGIAISCFAFGLVELGLRGRYWYIDHRVEH